MNGRTTNPETKHRLNALASDWRALDRQRRNLDQTYSELTLPIVIMGPSTDGREALRRTGATALLHSTIKAYELAMTQIEIRLAVLEGEG